MEKLKFGILGTGFIAEKFMAASRVIENDLSVRAVASRTKEKAIVYGENGCLIIHNYLGSQKVTLDINGGPPVDYEFSFEANGYEYEIRHACRCIREGKKKAA